MKLKDGFPRVLAKMYFESRVVRMPRTVKTKRLYAKIQAWKFLRIYFKVEYGLQKTNKGKMEMFYNDGIYDNKKDALFALKCFLE